MFTAFRRGLSEQGYNDGQNVEIFHRNADTQFGRLPALTAELLLHRVAAIFASGDAAALAAKAAATTTPIVFAIGGDPVEYGLVATLNRPSGNITGATFLAQELNSKRVQLLHEIVPAVTTIGLLVNSTNPANQNQSKKRR